MDAYSTFSGNLSQLRRQGGFYPALDFWIAEQFVRTSAELPVNLDRLPDYRLTYPIGYVSGGAMRSTYDWAFPF